MSPVTAAVVLLWILTLAMMFYLILRGFDSSWWLLGLLPTVLVFWVATTAVRTTLEPLYTIPGGY